MKRKRDGTPISRASTPSGTAVVKIKYTKETLPEELEKYWHQRYRLFARYDDGIWMDKEAWYSVTPEGIARHLARFISGKSRGGTIVDAFCGVGSNAIQFARYFDNVIAIDIDPVKINCAKHNAKIYGVLDKIQFINGNFFDHVHKADAVFMSPPWGGPSYSSQDMFDVEVMKPYSASEIFQHARKSTKNVALYLPRTTDVEQIAALGPTEVHYLYTSGRCKALCAYYGSLVS